VTDDVAEAVTVIQTAEAARERDDRGVSPVADRVAVHAELDPGQAPVDD
jgi:hypothetical protein